MGRSRRAIRARGLALAGALLTGAAVAQTAPQTPAPAETQGAVLTSPYDISACLCLQQELTARESELTSRRAAHEALARQIHDGQVALDDQRPLVDVNNQLAVDEFKQQLDQLDALKTRQYQETLPEYQAAIARYNDTVARYTQRCAGHPLDPDATQQVRAGLVCRLEK